MDAMILGLSHNVADYLAPIASAAPHNPVVYVLFALSVLVWAAHLALQSQVRTDPVRSKSDARQAVRRNAPR